LYPVLAARQVTKPEPPQTQKTFRLGADSVLLDIVIRDKKGKPLEDLSQNEIEVYEDSVKQTVTFFRKVGPDLTPPTSAVAREPQPAAQAPGIDPQRQINLVTLIFDQLGVDGRNLSRQAAMDFLSAPLPPNLFAAVFKIDRRVYALQQFTNDRKLLQGAVDKATKGTFTQFATQSEAIKQESEKAISSQETLNSAAASITAGTAPPSATGATIGAAAASAKMAQLMLNMLRVTEALQREQQGQSSLYGLLGLIREQRELTGRKTVIYFSEGLQVPPSLVEVLRTSISEANRANVSVYAVDARGLITSRLGQSGNELLTQTSQTSQRQTRSSHPVTREEVMISEHAEESIRMNTQEALADLAQSTGGLLIANTNDLRSGMHKVGEDIQSHYEVAYVPENRDYNGKFRSVSVKILRPGVSIQTRSGYFALPASLGPGVMAYEMPMLAALSASAPQRDFEYRGITFHFRPGANGVQYSLVIEVPISTFQLTPQPDGKTYRARIALLALIKDSDGKVIEKFTQESPLQGPLEQMETLKQRNFILMRHFRVPSGRYTVEMAAMDRESGKISVRRSMLIVPPSRQQLALSSLAVVKRIDPLPPNAAETEDPFKFGTAKVVPNIGGNLRAEPGRNLSLYFVVYVPAGSPRPELAMEVAQDGQVVARGTPELPAPNAQGEIPYVATLPIDSLRAGRYEIQVTVRQNGATATERTLVNLEK
jgi:VWFA-related protein